LQSSSIKEIGRHETEHYHHCKLEFLIWGKQQTYWQSEASHLEIDIKVAGDKEHGLQNKNLLRNSTEGDKHTHGMLPQNS